MTEYNLVYSSFYTHPYLVFVLFDTHPSLEKKALDLVSKRIIPNNQKESFRLADDVIFLGERFASAAELLALKVHFRDKRVLTGYHYDYSRAFLNFFESLNLIKSSPYIQDVPEELQQFLLRNIETTGERKGIPLDISDEYKGVLREYASYV